MSNSSDANQIFIYNEELLKGKGRINKKKGKGNVMIGM